MHALYQIKEMLMEELETNGEKKLTKESLTEIDTLAHALKNLCKVIESCEDEYSERGYARDYGNSYARRRDSMGRYTRDGYAERGMSREGGMSRDGMSRETGRSYGGNNDMVVEQLEQMMATAADDRTRGKFRELIREMRNA